MSKGLAFRTALQSEQPLQIVGTINAYCALMAKEAGFKALYVSGAGVANASYGLPDLGVTNLDDVLIDVRRITNATDLPVLVDVDTGFGDEVGIARTVREMIQAGAAGIHIEDQVAQKRCGHRPGKRLVESEEMCARLRVALQARDQIDPEFVIMARTDAVSVEGADAALARARRYCEVGADMIFAEALEDIDDYRAFTQAIDAPVLANLTEFGRTPMYTLDELRQVGVAMALYPLSAFRMMNQAAEQLFQVLRTEGTQKTLLGQMQTRDTLYEYLDYQRFEQQQG